MLSRDRELLRTDRLEAFVPSAEGQLGVNATRGPTPVWASTDGKTFINIVESDAPDMAASSTYAPFFEATQVFQVVAVEDASMQAIQAAQSNWS